MRPREASVTLDVRGVHPDASMLTPSASRPKLATTAARLLLDAFFHPVKPKRKRKKAHPWIAARCAAGGHPEWALLVPPYAWPIQWTQIVGEPMPWALDVISNVSVGPRRVLELEDLLAMGLQMGDERLDPEYPYYAATWRITCERPGAAGISAGRVWDSTAYCD